mmetsp:Transcript_7967/g.14036  ORF Transcript_7967/g.14036 Transcript_7967/m.14036 type:complete len:181 (+) Transcript_7967:106-648(+)
MVPPPSNNIPRRDLAMMATSTSVLVLVLIFSALSSSLFLGCLAFTPPAATRSHLQTSGVTVPSSPRRCLGGNQICRTRNTNASRSSRRVDTTSLPMGIRSFIKRKILRREKGEEDEEDDDADTEDADVTLHFILQSPGSAGLMESPLSSSTDDLGDSKTDNATSDKKALSKRKASKKIRG